jgi:hypothetical protein
MTPMEHLLGMKSDYSLLRTFGCACCPNLWPYTTHKLSFCSKRCVFLEYNPLHKGYKCLETSTRHVYISRDVIFDETMFPFASPHPNVGAQLNIEILLLPPTLRNRHAGVHVEGPDMPNPAIANPADNIDESHANHSTDTGEIPAANADSMQHVQASPAPLDHVVTEDPSVVLGEDSSATPRESTSGSESGRGLPAAAPESLSVDVPTRTDLLPGHLGSSTGGSAPPPPASSVPMHNADLGADLVVTRTQAPVPRSFIPSASVMTPEHRPVTRL